MAFFLLFLMEALAFAGLSEGADVLEDGPLNASVGGAVTFRTNRPPTEEPFLMVDWKFDESTPIITSILTVNNTAPDYEGRITLFRSTGSLELRNLALNDSGLYLVSILPVGENTQAGSTRLDIYEPVSGVTVTPQSADLVEFSGSVNLSCSSFGSSLSFLWMNSSSEVTADRVLISTTEGNSSLTIINVTRYDHGLFSCHVLNAVSAARSDPVNIFISYGPENTTLNVSPSKNHHEEGSDITLRCLAESRPSAEFTWFLNGDPLPDTGPELNLKNIQISQSGDYSCQAFNNKTRRYQTSQPTAVSVHARVSNVIVAPQGTDLVEFNSTVSLSCSSSGSSLSFFWTNSSSNVTASDRIQITDEGTKLTIVNVTRHDKGPYICNVFNPVSYGSSNPVNLSISYGPENIQLNVFPSKETYQEGSDIYLCCSVESEPVAKYLWLLDGNSLKTGSELSLINIQANQSGNYSCRTFNDKTMRNITSQPSVIIVHESTSSSGLSTGVIVAIVVVCLVVVIGLGVGYYMKVSKKPWKNPFIENTSRTKGGNNQINADNSSEEMNYARLKFPKKTKINKNPADSDNPLSEYAQVRVNNNTSAASWPPADEQSYTEVKIPTNKTGWVQEAETGFSSSDYAQIRVNSDGRPAPPPKTYKPETEKRPAPQPAANGEPVYGVVNKSQRR